MGNLGIAEWINIVDKTSCVDWLKACSVHYNIDKTDLTQLVQGLVSVDFMLENEVVQLFIPRGSIFLHSKTQNSAS